MPLLSHTQDPRLSRTILEPVSYLVLLSLAHFLSALLQRGGKLAPGSLQLGAAAEEAPHKTELLPFCSSVLSSSASIGCSNDLASLEIQPLPEVGVDCELCEEQDLLSWASLRRRLSLGRGSLLVEGVSLVRLSQGGD